LQSAPKAFNSIKALALEETATASSQIWTNKMAFHTISCNPLNKNFQPHKNTLDSSLDNSRENYKDVKVKLSIRTLEKVEALRKEWGLKRRSTVIERLLEIVLKEDKTVTGK